MKKIADIPKSKRPRERLQLFGAENLTEIELVAIILGSGRKNESVLEQAKKLLKIYPITSFHTLEIEHLIKTTTLGRVQAGKLIALKEIAARMSVSDSSIHHIIQPSDVIQHVSEIIYKKQEYLVGLYLNARNELIDKQIIAVGTLNQAIIEPRDILYHAVTLPSAFVILVHNHPSFDTNPSDEDILLTQRVVQAASFLGIMLIDHIIVSPKGFISLKEQQLM